MSNNSKILKMICYIPDYISWDDTINKHASKFYKTYSIYPNLMLASEQTWEKIDEFANLFNPDVILTEDGNIENYDEELKSISGFTTTAYSIDFCFDTKVNEDHFILVFNEEPIFDGEDYDKAENVKMEVYRRIA